MQRYSFHQSDSSTFVVIDQIEKRGICVCSDYDDWTDAEKRAKKITLLLNGSTELAT